MRKMRISRSVFIGSILTAAAVLFQSAPVFLPTIGLAISPFSTLPIAMAAAANISLGFTVLFSSALILAMVSTQEAIILLSTTGLLGIGTGILLYRKGIKISILFSSIALSLGMIFLTYIIGIPGFVDITKSLSTPIVILVFFIFSLVYTGIWNVCLRKFMIIL